MAVDRPQAVVEFPGADGSPETRSVVDVLRRALGKIVGLLDICVFFSPAGTSIAPGAGTVTVPGASAQVNTADTNLNEMRVVVDGATSAGTLTVDALDAAAGVSRCSVAVSTLTSYVGPWVKIPLRNADTQFVLRVIGNGGSTLTLYSAHLQFRTSSFQH